MLELEEWEPLVRTDPGLLERVVANLVANAVRASRPARRSGSTSRCGPDEMAIRVVDRGPGVSEAQRERMFEPFQRLATPRPGGLGLGLAVARGLADAMGATLVAEDTPGGGLTMVLAVPPRGGRIRRGPPACSWSTTSPPWPGRSRSTSAPTAGRSITAADGRRPRRRGDHAIPTSWCSTSVCPTWTACEVIEGIRGWTRVPIVVLSARQHGEDKVDALDLGADDYVTKPFAMKELMARLRAAVRRSPGAGARGRARGRRATWASTSAARRSPRGQDVRLTPTEWSFLELLARNLGKLVSREQILREVWGPAYVHESHYLRVYAAQLRRKLEDDPAHPRHLVTSPGLGYMLEP